MFGKPFIVSIKGIAKKDIVFQNPAITQGGSDLTKIREWWEGDLLHTVTSEGCRGTSFRLN